MDSKRVVLYLLLIVLFVALWDIWQKDYPPPTPITPSQTVTTQQPSTVQPAIMPPSTELPSTPPEAVVSATENLITVKTDVLEVGIDPKGGNIVLTKLLKFPMAVNRPNDPVTILSPQSDQLYLAQNGVAIIGQSPQQQPMVFHSSKPNYFLEKDQKELAVQLTSTDSNGAKVIKTFLFTRNQYAIQSDTSVENRTNENLQLHFYHQIVRRNAPPQRDAHSRSFDGAAISSPDTPYQKLSFKLLNEQSLDQQIQGGWVAMQQAYFLTAWIPANQQQINRFYRQVTGGAPKEGKNNIFTIGFHGPLITLAPRSTITENATLYVGPKIARQLRPLAKGLDLTIDYGWLSILAVPIFKVMEIIHRVVGNWGWSIVLVTILIKLIFYKFSSMSYLSMAKMRDLQPRMQALKERYGTDRQALSKATMELYKSEKVNPMGGCLPMLIQLPFFIALYSVLTESVELRQAPFILWIHDLSVKDPYLILPILMSISMFVQQKLSPPPPDPNQAKVMMFLPFIFFFFFYTFPAGLVLYWLTNNCFSIFQQWWTMRNYQLKKLKKSTKHKKLIQHKKKK